MYRGWRFSLVRGEARTEAGGATDHVAEARHAEPRDAAEAVVADAQNQKLTPRPNFPASGPCAADRPVEPWAPARLDRAQRKDPNQFDRRPINFLDPRKLSISVQRSTPARRRASSHHHDQHDRRPGA